MKYLFLLTSALALATPALAQEGSEIVLADAIRDTLITVTATGNPIRIDEAGQPISVIGAAEIASIQGPDITRVLERLPGVTFARNGGEHVEVFGRIENVTDEEYATVGDYGTAGRSAFVGVRAKM